MQEIQTIKITADFRGMQNNCKKYGFKVAAVLFLHENLQFWPVAHQILFKMSLLEDVDHSRHN